MRQKKRCPLAEDILKNFPGDSVFLYPNLGIKRGLLCKTLPFTTATSACMPARTKSHGNSRQIRGNCTTRPTYTYTAFRVRKKAR